MKVEDILSAARECIGTPFAHQGRVPGVGIDCAGLVCHVATRLGLHYDTPTNYPRTPYKGLLRAVLDRQNSLMHVDDHAPGDVLLMRFKNDPQHLAIVSDIGIIHAYESAGKCCEHSMDRTWHSRIICAYRFRGVE